MASGVYDAGAHLLQSRITNNINFVSDTIRILLLQETYTLDKAHQFITNLTPGTHELSVGGYSRGTLASPSITKNTTLHRIIYDGANYDFGALATGQNIRYIILAKHVTDDTDSPLIVCLDLGTNVPTNGSPVEAQWHSDGIFYSAQ